MYESEEGRFEARPRARRRRRALPPLLPPSYSQLTSKVEERQMKKRGLGDSADGRRERRASQVTFKVVEGSSLQHPCTLPKHLFVGHCKLLPRKTTWQYPSLWSYKVTKCLVHRYCTLFSESSSSVLWQHGRCTTGTLRKQLTKLTV